MSDLFSPLRESRPTPAPPAEDVRRRGDRIRRRRQALSGGAVLVVVAGVLVGGQLLAGAERTSGSAPHVAGQPTAGPPAIPDDFDLGAGIPGALGQLDEDRGEWLSGVVLCGASYSPADPAVDSASVLAVGDDRATGRHLRLYEDDTTAVTVALDFVAVAEGCPQFEIDGGASQGRNEVSVIDIGSRSRTWLVRQTYTGEEPGQNLLVVSQTGNTVLVAFRDPARSSANGSTGTAEEVTAFTTELGRHVVPRLECTFVTRDC